MLLLVQGRHNIRNISRYHGYGESTLSRRMGHCIDFGLFHQPTVEMVIDPSTQSEWGSVPK